MALNVRSRYGVGTEDECAVHVTIDLTPYLPVALTTARCRSKTIDLGLCHKGENRIVAPLPLYVIVYYRIRLLSSVTTSSQCSTTPFMLFSNPSFATMDKVLEPVQVLRVFFLAAASTVHCLLYHVLPFPLLISYSDRIFQWRSHLTISVPCLRFEGHA